MSAMMRPYCYQRLLGLLLYAGFASAAGLSAEDSSATKIDISAASSIERSPDALGIHQSVAFLKKASGNNTIVELGNRLSAQDHKAQIEAGNWWDVAEQTSAQFGLELKPTSNLAGRHLSLSSENKGYRLQGKAITETIAFAARSTKPLGPSGVQHIGPWRIEAEPVEMAIQHSLSGTNRWLSLQFTVLGEPKLMQYGSYHVDAWVTEALSESGEELALSNAEPRMFGSTSGRLHRHHRSSFHRSQRHQPQLFISQIASEDGQIQLKGNMSVVHLADWDTKIALTPNKWHALQMGTATLHLAIIQSSQQVKTLRKEIGLSGEREGYSVPNILIALESDQELPATTQEYMLQNLVVEQDAAGLNQQLTRALNRRTWSEHTASGKILFLRREIVGQAAAQPKQPQTQFVLRGEAAQGSFDTAFDLFITVPKQSTP